MSSPFHEHVVKFIHHVWGSKDYFPGPQPISIERKHFPILKGTITSYVKKLMVCVT